MNDPLLQLEAVEKRYGKAPVLTAVDLSLQAGEFVVLIGGSGFGKTTFLRVVGGLGRAARGVLRPRSPPVDVPADGGLPPPGRRPPGLVFLAYAPVSPPTTL